MNKGIKLNGIIDFMGHEISDNQFWEDFIGFVENKGWAYAGGIELVDLDQ